MKRLTGRLRIRSRHSLAAERYVLMVPEELLKSFNDIVDGNKESTQAGIRDMLKVGFTAYAVVKRGGRIIVEDEDGVQRELILP